MRKDMDDDRSEQKLHPVESTSSNAINEVQNDLECEPLETSSRRNSVEETTEGRGENVPDDGTAKGSDDSQHETMMASLLHSDSIESIDAYEFSLPEDTIENTDTTSSNSDVDDTNFKQRVSPSFKAIRKEDIETEYKSGNLKRSDCGQSTDCLETQLYSSIDLTALQDSLLDLPLDFISEEKNDICVPEIEETILKPFVGGTHEQPHDNEIHQEIIFGDSGYTTDNLYSLNDSAILIHIHRNVKHGTEDDLIEGLTRMKYGGIITDRRLAAHEEGSGQTNVLYRIIRRQDHTSVCRTVGHGYNFIMKKVSRRSVNVYQFDRYIKAGQISGFVPTVLGVVFENEHMDILFAFRECYSLEEFIQMGKVIKGLELARFVSYLLEAVQVLHRDGISSLSIRPSAITFDVNFNLASFQFADIKLDDTYEEPNTDSPTYTTFDLRKSRDMYDLGALICFLMNIGTTEIAGLDVSTYKRIVSGDEENRTVMPYVVHLVQSLMNPNTRDRLTAETAFHHVFFRRCSKWIVAVTNGSRVFCLTSAEDGTPLHELLSDRRLREMIGQDVDEPWFTEIGEENTITICSHMEIELCMRD